MSSWKAEYLRILYLPKIDKIDYKLAAELVDEDYATGNYHCETSSGKNQIDYFAWGGINAKGRVYADHLELMINKESTKYKIIQFFLWFSGILIGYIVKSLAC